MIINIYTDAAYHTKEKVGGYGFWIECESKKITCSGLIKKTHSALNSELSAINLALQDLIDDPDITEAKRLYIFTDCKQGIGLILEKRKGLAKDTARLLSRVKKKLGMSEVRNERIFNHVKAHTGVNDKKSFINEWCDKKAKMWLWRKVNNEYMPEKHERNVVIKEVPKVYAVPVDILIIKPGIVLPEPVKLERSTSFLDSLFMPNMDNLILPKK